MSFTIAHDYKNSKVAHMTGTGIVFIEYIGSIFEPQAKLVTCLTNQGFTQRCRLLTESRLI